MANQLAALSNEIAAAVAEAARNVVAVHARPRFSSSGVFWRPGVIVTAEHTIRREEEITVTLPDGTNVPASLAGTDSGTDIAVLKIDNANQTPGITTAAPVPGTLALTIGRSEDSGPNATLGIISACSGEWRTWRGGRLDHYVRLDLTLYPGSDGGAVVNTAGETIGIATSALSRIAGLAIPAVTVDRVVDEILARGHVARGYLGVGLQPVELPDHHKGLIVLSLEPAGPAAKAGVLIGDIVVQLGGKAVQDTDDIQRALEGHAVGQGVPVDILRGGESRQIAVTIAERPRSN
jgi:S1-C subfamily serine protease